MAGWIFLSPVLGQRTDSRKERIMATTLPIHPSAAARPTETEVVHSTHTLLKWAYGLVPIIAGADKFTNLIVNWEQYLNPAIPQLLNVTPHAFMLAVGVVEIIAGILVFAKPRAGGLLVMAWLIGIALQLVSWGRHLDIAIRDIVLALGALTLARLSPYAHATDEIHKSDGWKS
jgi:uncharacterized membrane protein YphA (DoxX/SURF4 family)